MDESDYSRKRLRETTTSTVAHGPAPIQAAASSLALAVSAVGNSSNNDILMQGNMNVWQPDDFDDISIDLNIEDDDADGKYDTDDK